jgi:hypothetical protein
MPLMVRSISNNSSIRRTASIAIGAQRCFIASRFKFSFDGGDDVFLRALDLVRGEDCGFNCAIGDCLQHLQSNRAIDPHTSDADAQSRAHMSIIAAALIAMSVAFAHAVEDPHHSSTSAASHQAGEQCAAPARRFACTVLLHMCVLE